MNLLAIIRDYLEILDNQGLRDADDYLWHLVDDAGMDKVLVPHIKGCASTRIVGNVFEVETLVDLGFVTRSPISPSVTWEKVRHVQ